MTEQQQGRIVSAEDVERVLSWLGWDENMRDSHFVRSIADLLAAARAEAVAPYEARERRVRADAWDASDNPAARLHRIRMELDDEVADTAFAHQPEHVAVEFTGPDPLPEWAEPGDTHNGVSIGNPPSPHEPVVGADGWTAGIDGTPPVRRADLRIGPPEEPLLVDMIRPRSSNGEVNRHG